ncbi:MAG: hypothetical protein CMB80_18540 [Flammeovirgaceae bacterium]|nr:hypothetical protein [Flammeovirgaceae bacterium]HCX22311.1 hypothetical protein [Cytophagales bacterium]
MKKKLTLFGSIIAIMVLIISHLDQSNKLITSYSKKEIEPLVELSSTLEDSLMNSLAQIN